MAESTADAFKAVKEAIREAKLPDNTKINYDPEKKVIRLYVEGASPLDRASSGLSEVLELSYTSAEHHPYWAILYHSAEICRSVIDGWDAELSKAGIEEMEWRIEEIRMALDRAKR